MAELWQQLTRGWTTAHYAIVGGLVIVWVGSCARLALAISRKTGRSFGGVFLLTVLTFGLAGWILVNRDMSQAAAKARARRARQDLNAPGPVPGLSIACPKCGQPITRQDLEEAGSLEHCPKCHANLAEDL